jgi:hypothetical protein
MAIVANKIFRIVDVIEVSLQQRFKTQMLRKTLRRIGQRRINDLKFYKC